MTTVQLGQRLCNYLANGNLKEISAGTVAMLVDAINAGLGEMQRFLPASRFTSIVSFPVGVPRSETVTINASGDVLISSTLPAASDAGNTVQIGDDLAANSAQAVEAGTSITLMRPYVGAAGAQVLTLYDDAVLFDYNDASIRPSVVFVSSAAGRRIDLDWLDKAPDKNPLATGTPSQCWLTGYAPIRYTQYWEMPRVDVYPQPATSGAWLLKLWPLPAVAGAIEVELRTFETGLVFRDLSVNTRFFRFSPIESAHLVSLAAEAMLPQARLAEHVSRNDIIEAAKRARSWLSSRRPDHVHGVQSLSTEPGY